MDMFISYSFSYGYSFRYRYRYRYNILTIFYKLSFIIYNNYHFFRAC